MERYFAEPADVRPDASAAGAARDLALVSLPVVEGRTVAGVAAALEQLAMHVRDALRARLFVKIVHILGAEEQPLTDFPLQPRQRAMARVGLLVGRRTPPHGI